MAENEHTAENDAATLALVRALWTAADVTDEMTIGWQWDDLPEPQRSNWLALAKTAQTLGVCVVPPASERDPLECPPDGGCGGCGNWPEQCACPIPPAADQGGTDA